MNGCNNAPGYKNHYVTKRSELIDELGREMSGVPLEADLERGWNRKHKKH